MRNVLPCPGGTSVAGAGSDCVGAVVGCGPWTVCCWLSSEDEDDELLDELSEEDELDDEELSAEESGTGIGGSDSRSSGMSGGGTGG